VAVAFATRLRAAGLDVPVSSAVAFASALQVVSLDRRREVYWAARATLVRRPEDVAAFDRVFAQCFGGDEPATSSEPLEVPMTLALDSELADAPADADEVIATGPVITVRYSAREVLRHRDFATCTPDELHEAHRLMADLRVLGPSRRSRRQVRAAGPGGRPDLRRTVRAALRTGGEPARLASTGPSTRPRRLVLLLDVSGSMQPYARALLRFAQAAVAGRSGTRVEVFTLGTRLTRLTRALGAHDPDAALERAGSAVPDWSGGTRLGDGLRRFNDDWGVRGMARGAVVVICSDGWDRGDPAVLGEQVRRLHLVAHKLVWVNPLKAAPGFAPVAKGMAAALPHVDQLVAGHSVAALDDLARIVGTS
jgi:uncharacterized protein with von Willebrand factor type A (vWA) domain